MRASKIILFLLCFSLLAHPAAAFSDTKQHWAAPSIDFLAQQGWLNGYEDGSFLPEGNITRAEGAKLVISVAQLPTGSFSGCFADVTEADWFWPYAETLEKYDFFMENNGLFLPNQAITREELAYILVQSYLALTGESAGKASSFSDQEESAYPEVIAQAQTLGLVNGFEDATFRPKEPVTRAQAAVMAHRFYQRLYLLM